MAVGALAHPPWRYKVGGRWRRKWSDERGTKEKTGSEEGREQKESGGRRAGREQPVQPHLPSSSLH